MWTERFGNYNCLMMEFLGESQHVMLLFLVHVRVSDNPPHFK